MIPCWAPLNGSSSAVILCTMVLHTRRLLVLLNKMDPHLFLLGGQQHVETQFRFV
jgi:hypothetical protein